MIFLDRIKKGIPEFSEQAAIVANSYSAQKYSY